MASGPSAKVDLEAVRGTARVIAVNSSIRLCPWADAIYAADVRWWRENGRLWRGFGGLRLGMQASIKGVCPDAHVFRQMPGPGYLRGRNSGHQAADLAVTHLGVRRLGLVGFDMSAERGIHWHGRHGDRMINPTARRLAEWARQLDVAEFDAEIVVVRETALTAYPVMEWAEAVKWLVS